MRKDNITLEAEKEVVGEGATCTGAVRDEKAEEGEESETDVV